MSEKVVRATKAAIAVISLVGVVAVVGLLVLPVLVGSPSLPGSGRATSRGSDAASSPLDGDADVRRPSARAGSPDAAEGSADGEDLLAYHEPTTPGARASVGREPGPRAASKTRDDDLIGVGGTASGGSGETGGSGNSDVPGESVPGGGSVEPGPGEASGSSSDGSPGGASPAGSGSSQQWPNGSDASGGGRPQSGAAPAADKSPPAAPAAYTTLSGRVAHEVWGVPVSGVRIVLSGRATAVSGSDGIYKLVVPATGELGTIALDLSGTSWLTHGASVGVVALAPGTSVRDFSVYHSDEAQGDSQNSTGWWKNWGFRITRPQMDAIAGRVRSASRTFPSVGSDSVSGVVSGRGSPSTETRAKGELLAMWLNVASGRLGFDTAVDVSNVSGWAEAVPSANTHGRTSALRLVRDLDNLAASGARGGTLWSAVSGCASPRALGPTAASAAGFDPVAPVVPAQPIISEEAPPPSPAPSQQVSVPDKSGGGGAMESTRSGDSQTKSREVPGLARGHQNKLAR